MKKILFSILFGLGLLGNISLWLNARPLDTRDVLKKLLTGTRHRERNNQENVGQQPRRTIIYSPPDTSQLSSFQEFLQLIEETQSNLEQKEIEINNLKLQLDLSNIFENTYKFIEKQSPQTSQNQIAQFKETLKKQILNFLNFVKDPNFLLLNEQEVPEEDLLCKLQILKQCLNHNYLQAEYQNQ